MSAMSTWPTPRRGDAVAAAGAAPGAPGTPGIPAAEEIDADESHLVRPYTVTRGRTRSAAGDIPLESLVRSTGEAPVGTPTETRRILDLTAAEFLSVAELSAHAKLPVGVVRVLLGDLLAEGRVSVSGPVPTSGQQSLTPSFSVLESVLDGISAL